jgi:hypothetical protein
MRILEKKCSSRRRRSLKRNRGLLFIYSSVHCPNTTPRKQTEASGVGRGRTAIGFEFQGLDFSTEGEEISDLFLSDYTQDRQHMDFRGWVKTKGRDIPSVPRLDATTEVIFGIC